MADVKIGCPNCNQHIQCDPAWLGRTLQCPSCQKEFTAAPLPSTPATPQPPPEPPPEPPPPSRPSNPDPAPPPTTAPNRSRLALASFWLSAGSLLLPITWIGGIVCGHLARARMRRDPRLEGHQLATAGLVIGYIFLLLSVTTALLLPSFLNNTRGGPPRETAPSARRLTDEHWSLDLTKATTPAQPARGWIAGRPFKLERANVFGDTLHLRQGNGFHPGLAISIVLLLEPGTSVSRQSFLVLPEDGLGSPHIELAWTTEGQTIPAKQLYVAGYSLKLEFGELKEQSVSGTLHLCLPDDEKSYVAGTFTATVH